MKAVTLILALFFASCAMPGSPAIARSDKTNSYTVSLTESGVLTIRDYKTQLITYQKYSEDADAAAEFNINFSGFSYGAFFLILTSKYRDVALLYINHGVPTAWVSL